MRQWMNLFENAEYPPVLDEDGLIDYALSIAHADEADEVDPNFLREIFRGAVGVLKMVPITRLAMNGGVKVASRTAEYKTLTTTAPPIIVEPEGSVIKVIDGNHRVREAQRRKQTEIMAYVLQDADPEPPL